MVHKRTIISLTYKSDKIVTIIDKIKLLYEMNKILILLLYLLYSYTHTYANTLLEPLNITHSHKAIGKSLLVYEDKEASLKVSDIVKLPNHAFHLLGASVSSNSFTRSAYWYKFDINNPTDTLLSRLIIFEPSWLDHVNITVVSPQGDMQSYEAGNTLPYHHRYLKHYLINLKHTFQVGQSTVYIQVKTRDPFIVAISVMEESTFLAEDSLNSLWIGLIYGGLIALLIYNLFLYFGIKERYYLYYVLYLLTFITMNASYNGYTFMVLTSNYPEVQNWLHSILAYLFVLSLLLFTNSFLNLKTRHPKLYLTTNYLIYSLIILFFLSAFLGGYHYHVFFAIISVIFYSGYIFAVGVYSLSRGNKSARFFILGIVSGLSGVFITALTLMSFIPYTYFTYKASDFGVFIDVLLLSLALADRMKITQEEKMKAEKNATTDILTGILNRRGFNEVSNIEYQRLMRYHRDFSVAMLDIDNFKQFNDTYGHLVGDILLQRVATVLKDTLRENDYAFRVGGDEFILFLIEANKEEAYALAERIRKDIETIHMKENKRHFPISCSIGISSYRATDEDLKDVVRRTDEALYVVKNSGKNGTQIWKPTKSADV